MHGIQLSLNMIVTGSLISQASRNVWKAGFWQREPEEKVCIVQKMLLFQTVIIAGSIQKHTLVWFRVRSSFPGPGN